METENETHVSTWEECKQLLLKIEKDNSTREGRVWFRGVPNAAWPLATTLDRRVAPLSVADYYSRILRVKPEVEAFTGSTWDVPPWHEPDQWGFADFFRQIPAYGYMAHLRHHGFPSPLLDWSRSPYVAAYFAFASEQAKLAGKVAIYVFSEISGMRDPTKPRIIGHGGYNLNTHERHFRQQSTYTVCVEYNKGTKQWRYVCHQEVFNLPQTERDLLRKITVPSGERANVLRLLDRFNLNGFTLFGSQEHLMETLAIRQIDQEFPP